MAVPSTTPPADGERTGLDASRPAAGYTPPPDYHDCDVLHRYGYQDRDTEQAFLVEIATKGESRAAWDLYWLTIDLELLAEQAEDEGRPSLAAIIRHGAWCWTPQPTGTASPAGTTPPTRSRERSPRRNGGRTSRWSPQSSTSIRRRPAGTRGAARRSWTGPAVRAAGTGTG
jgi:hypothetical protein